MKKNRFNCDKIDYEYVNNKAILNKLFLKSKQLYDKIRDLETEEYKLQIRANLIKETETKPDEYISQIDKQISELFKEIKSLRDKKLEVEKSIDRKINELSTLSIEREWCGCKKEGIF